MKNLIDSLHLLNFYPGYNSKPTITVFSVSIFFVLLGLIILFALAKTAKKIPPYNEIKNKFASVFLTCGGIGLFLSFCAWQEIPYLSGTLMILILSLIFVIWILYILIYLKRDFFKELEKFKRDERYKKYFP